MERVVRDDKGKILYTKNGTPRKNKIYNEPKFRKRAGVHWSERKQGLIFYMCKNYPSAFTDKEKVRFVKLCDRCSRGKCEALMVFLITEMRAEDVCAEYNVSRTRLYEYAKDFYNNFDYVKPI